MQDARVRTLEETIVVPGQRGWWRLAWNCIIRLGTSRISMSCIFHEARSRGGNHIAFGSPDAVPSAFSPSPPFLLRGKRTTYARFLPLPLLFSRVSYPLPSPLFVR